VPGGDGQSKYPQRGQVFPHLTPADRDTQPAMNLTQGKDYLLAFG
jgi:hypothetical protein